jgi:nucleoside-diphosphate-sugar epimerase
MNIERVLITGMSGLIGSAVRRTLEGRYTLRALNRSAVSGVECFQADIKDLGAIQEAFEGVDAVVHLAAKSDRKATWDEVRDFNVIGTYNVFEAARRAGVKRIVYASSGATVSGWERESPYRDLVSGNKPESWPMITHEQLANPQSLYACSKLWGEALARCFTNTFDMSIICLRIGMVQKGDRPTTDRSFSIWCSQRDITQMIQRCLEAPDSLRFDIFFVTSNNELGYRDLTHGREVVGYEPQDSAEDHR